MNVISFFFALTLCPLLILVSRKFKLYDLPNDRKSHKVPTPKMGGLAILLSFLVASYFNDFIDISLIISSVLLVFLVLMDDFFSLNRYLRLIVQFILVVPIIFHLDLFDKNILIVLLSSLFMVYSINIFNFFDGLNGLLTSQFLLISSTYLIFINANGLLDYKESLFSLILASVAFLIFNISGVLFMGDIGSCFLGLYTSYMVLSSLMLQNFNAFIFVITPLLPLFIDCTLVLLIRFKNREKFFSTPHNQHSYQLLNRIGISHLGVSGVYAIKFLIYNSVLFFYTLGKQNLSNMILFILFLVSIDVMFCLCVRKLAFRRKLI